MSLVKRLSEAPVLITKLPRLCLNGLNGLPDSAGVYFVLDPAERVWYVGLAVSLRQRWQAHEHLNDCRSNGAEFVALREIPTDHERRELERRCIKFFRPPINDRMNNPDLPTVDFGLSPQKEVERFLRLQIQKRIIEMEIELLKPNLISQCDASSDGKITHALGTISPRDFISYGYSPEVERLAADLKTRRDAERSDGISSVKGLKRSPVARINPFSLREAFDIHFDELSFSDEAEGEQGLEAA